MNTNQEQKISEEGLDELLKRATAEEVKDEEEKITVTEEEKPKKISSEEKAHEAFEELTSEEDSVSLSMRTIIGGDILAGRWFRHQLKFLMALAVLTIFYVTNRYSYQQEIIENKRLTLLLEDRRLRAIVATSDLTEYTRRSNIEQHLSDTTLKSSPTPFYYLQTK